MFHVIVSVKLDNEWNEWVFVGGFSIASLGPDDTYEKAARRARLIVDRKGEDKVEVQVLNNDTKLYDRIFFFDPITF